MRKKTHFILFIFVLIAGTAYVNLTASEEQKREDRTRMCQRMKQRSNTVSQANQHAKSEEESGSKKEKELTIEEAIAKYLYNKALLDDPNLSSLHPSKRLLVPYKPNLETLFLLP